MCGEGRRTRRGTHCRVRADAREVVERLVWPVANRRAERAARDRIRRELWTWLHEHPVVRAQPALGAWADAVERAGLVNKSVPATRALLEQAVAVLAVLPATGLPLPVLAEQTVNDTHALDEGTRLRSLVMRGLAEIYQSPVPTDAGAARRMWELAGVADDELSPPCGSRASAGCGAGQGSAMCCG
ncbi:TIGR02679 domain-containing protein [Nocardia thailandica]